MRKRKQILQRMVNIVKSKEIPMPEQGPIQLNQEYTSNIGQSGYEGHVRRLKEHITNGTVIQAVPSQRFSRPTSLHPFNVAIFVFLGLRELSNCGSKPGVNVVGKPMGHARLRATQAHRILLRQIGNFKISLDYRH